MTVGGTARTLIVGLLLGLGSLVAFIRANPKTSDYYIGGYSRASVVCRKYVVVVAVCSYVGDSFLAEVLEDSRVARRWQELYDCIQSEMQYVAAISEGAWQLLGSVCDTSGAALRSAVISAAHTSVAFLMHRVLAPANKGPWSLRRGDLVANVQQLAEQDEPQEPTTKKIWHVARMGYSEGQLLAGLRLIGDCPWSSNTVEQLRGSIATMHKARREYSAATLAARSFMHQVRSLVRPFLGEAKVTVVGQTIKKLQ